MEERNRTGRQGEAISDDQSDVVWLAMVELWKKRFLIGILGAAFAVLALLASFLMTPRYRAEVTVLPKTGGASSGLMAMIGMATNISIGEGVALEDLYPSIVKSNRVLDSLLEREYLYQDRSASLYEIFGIDQTRESRADSLRAAFRLKKRLARSVIGTGTDVNTGLLRLSVTVPRDPVFAAQLANTLSDALDGFIQEAGLMRAEKQLRYIGKRLDEVSAQLNVANDGLMEFRAENRDYAGSPKLIRLHDDMMRERDVLSLVWSELTKQHEIAKVEANKEQHALEILDEATAPVRRCCPNRIRMAVLGLVVGSLLLMALIVVRSLWVSFTMGRGTRRGER